MTGYALKLAISQTIGHFWNESVGQIYPTLRRLEDQGLLERTRAMRRDSSVFSVTPSGLKQLRSLLREPPPPQTRRNALLLRLFFGRHLGPAHCRALLQGARDQATRELESYEHLSAALADEAGYAHDREYWLLTLMAGIHAARATIAWADESLQRLPDTMGQTSKRPGRPR